jgi:hypothetical protein
MNSFAVTKPAPHEKEGWICQEQLVYLAFDFESEKQVADPGDSLVRVSLNSSLCLDLP